MAFVTGITLSSDRVPITSGAAQVADYVEQGLGRMNSGNLAVDTDAVPAPPAGYTGGFAVNASGAVYGTTTTAGTDVWEGGVRRSLAGALVYELAATTQYDNGNPLTANGVLAVI